MIDLIFCMIKYGAAGRSKQSTLNTNGWNMQGRMVVPGHRLYSHNDKVP